MPKVAVIIVNYNGEKYLPALFGSIFKYPSKVDFKLFFIDNSSQDDSVKFVQSCYPQAEVLKQEENLGFAAGNNVGLRLALEQGFDYAMLLNQDTRVTESYLDLLVKAMEQDESIAAVQPKLLMFPRTDLINSLGNKIHYLGFGYTYGYLKPNDDSLVFSKEINYCSGAACLIRISALKISGLFQENFFMYHEDLDLGWRFKLMGYKNIIEPSAVVYHQYEFSRSIKKYYFMERNRFLVILQNYHFLTLLLILPALVIMELAVFLFSFKNGWWREKLKIYGYFFYRKHWQMIFENRSKTQALRKLTDRKTVSDFSGLIEHQEVSNILLDKIANPIFNLYWRIVKQIIIW